MTGWVFIAPPHEMTLITYRFLRLTSLHHEPPERKPPERNGSLFVCMRLWGLHRFSFRCYSEPQQRWRGLFAFSRIRMPSNVSDEHSRKRVSDHHSLTLHPSSDP
jgi:hypothetical protein